MSLGEGRFIPVDEDIPTDHLLPEDDRTGARILKEEKPLPIEKPVELAKK